MKESARTTNSKPFTLAPHSFEDVVRKALSTQPPEKQPKRPTAKKNATKGKR
jgi:hypothetical protein